MRVLALVAATSTLVTLASAPATAQVNTEKLRSWEKAGLSGSLDFALTYRSGNVNLLLVGTSVRVQWARLAPKTSTSAPDRLRDLVYFVGDQTFGLRGTKNEATGEVEDDRFKNAGFGHLRWTHMWAPVFGSEVFVQAQYNEFIKLQQRYLGGLGGRLEVVAGKYGEVTVGTGYMLEFEQYDVPDDSDDRRVLAHRWTSYLSLKGYLSDPSVSVVNTVYAQPRLTDFADYRILDEAELIVELTDILSLVAGLYLRFDNQPVEGVEKLDVTMENKLRVVF